MAPAVCWNWGESGVKEYKWNGPFLVHWAHCTDTRDFYPALVVLVNPVRNIFYALEAHSMYLTVSSWFLVSFVMGGAARAGRLSSFTHLLPHPPQYGPPIAFALIACYFETSLPPIPWKLRISIRKCKGTGDIIGGTGEKRVIKNERKQKVSKKRKCRNKSHKMRKRGRYQQKRKKKRALGAKKKKKKRALWAKKKEKEGAMSKTERKRGRYEQKRKKRALWANKKEKQGAMSKQERKRARCEEKRKKKRALWAKKKEKERTMSKKERKRGRYEQKRKKKRALWAKKKEEELQMRSREMLIRIPGRSQEDSGPANFFPSQLGEYWSVCTSRRVGGSQSRQRAKLFSSRRNWDSPHLLNRKRVCPPTHGTGGRGKAQLAGERGVGRVPLPTREHTLWYSLYICTVLCGEDHSSLQDTKKPVLCT